MFLEQAQLCGLFSVSLVSPSQHSALPERRVFGWRSSGRLERFAEMAHEAGNTFRVSDQGEQAHATAAARAQRELEAQRSSQELGPWPIARACRVLVASRRFVRAES